MALTSQGSLFKSSSAHNLKALVRSHFCSLRVAPNFAFSACQGAKRGQNSEKECVGARDPGMVSRIYSTAIEL